MKNSVRLLLLLCFFVILTVSLSACNNADGDDPAAFNPESPVALWEKIEEATDELESVEMRSTRKAISYYMGYRFEMNTVANSLTIGNTHYMDTEATTTCDELSFSQTMHRVEAYYDGKMYSAMDDGFFDQKFCSAMTEEEFLQARKTGLSIKQIGLTDCTTMDFSKGENGSWNLSFSGYTKKTMDKVLSIMQLMDDMLGASIADMEVNLVADSSFHVCKMEVAFVFSEKNADQSALPEFTTVTEYFNHNSATFDPAVLQADTYTQVEDVRILDDISKALRDKQEAASEKFTLNLTTTYDIQGQKSTYHETDIVEYGWKNGAYFYFITAEMDAQKFVIQYQNGEQTVVADGQTQSVSQPEEEAKAFIDSLIDSAKYNGGAVTGIESKEPGVYLLTLEKVDLAVYAPLLVGSDIELTAGTQEITVAFQDGELVKMESRVAFNAVYEDEAVVIIMESDLVFEDDSDAANQ